MNHISPSRRHRLARGVACIALLVAGCSGSSWMSPFSAYRMDIQQGNAITQEMVVKLKPGMTRAQVKFALGTPLIVDTFRTDRWDYVYYLQKPNGPREYRHIVAVFKGDRLERLEGDVVPLREGKGTLSIDKVPAAAGTPSARAAVDGAASGPSAQKAPTSGSESGNQTSGPSAQKAPSTGSEPATQDSKEKKPATPAPAKEGGYSEPITESLGF
ncbi:MAG TPA: outer membrane protein assembly factor BamE [Burkholderiales bacterium]|jgi:outer membrane protein assembly factor BamE|nr:outer membrane protein assembly factor BamE [Burkholderiales bacterium]